MEGITFTLVDVFSCIKLAIPIIKNKHTLQKSCVTADISNVNHGYELLDLT